MNLAPPLPRPLPFVALGWLALALTLALSDAYRALPPLVPLMLIGTVLGAVAAWRRSPPLRAWTGALDLRLPILIHVSRVAFGALFLVEHAAGRLPAYFAVKAGIGDIIAGALAVVAALAATSLTAKRRMFVLAWNVIGLVDIVLVVLTAQYGLIVLRDPLILDVLGRLPYALLPTVIVPVVILTHILVFQRLRALNR